jgi:hypothetical protein
MKDSTVRHCPGCLGYTRGTRARCNGLGTAHGDFIVPDVVPPLSFRDRIRVLFGYPVLMGVAAGPVSEPFDALSWEDRFASQPGPDDNGFKS